MYNYIYGIPLVFPPNQSLSHLTQPHLVSILQSQFLAIQIHLTNQRQRVKIEFSPIDVKIGISSGQRFCSPLGLRKMMGSCTARQKMRNFAADLSGGV